MRFSQLIAKVAFIVDDVGGVTYTADIVREFLADAELSIVNLKPGANPATGQIDATAGTKQAIPSDGVRLLAVDLIGGRSARLVERGALDDLNPFWRNETPANSAGEYIVDDRQPKAFETPPLQAGVAIALTYDQFPEEYDFVQNPDPELSLDRHYGPAMVDYAVYRCLSRADENTAELAKAMAHQRAFLSAIGAQAQIDSSQTPRARRHER